MQAQEARPPLKPNIGFKNEQESIKPNRKKNNKGKGSVKVRRQKEMLNSCGQLTDDSVQRNQVVKTPGHKIHQEPLS
jgi:hypothetical protein